MVAIQTTDLYTYARFFGVGLPSCQHYVVLGINRFGFGQPESNIWFASLSGCRADPE